MLPQQKITGKITCTDLKPYNAVIPVIRRAYHIEGPDGYTSNGIPYWSLAGASFYRIDIRPWNGGNYTDGFPFASYTAGSHAQLRSAVYDDVIYQINGGNYLSWMPFGSETVSGYTGNITSLECKSSRNSLNWSGPKGPRVGTLRLTKPKLPMRRPTPPQVPFLLASPDKPVARVVHFDTKFRPRRNGETAGSYDSYLYAISTKQKTLQNKMGLQEDRRYAKALRRYEKEKDVREQKNLKTRQNFTKALKKYQERTLRFESFEERRKTAEFSKTRGPVTPADNPYGYLLLVPNGPLQPGMRSFRMYEYFRSVLERSTPIILGSNGQNATCIQALDQTRLAFFAIADEFLTEVDDRLIAKLYKKLGNQQVHIGNLLAERKQTLDMFRDVFKRLLTLVRLKGHVLRQVAKFAKNPKKIADDVLAFKFGAEPLMQDLEGLVEKLHSTSDESPVVAVRTNYGGFRTETLEFTKNGFSFSGKVVVSYVLKMSLDSSFAKTLQEYGLVSHTEILWEITPWSFVVDWFLPIGQYIASGSADVGMQFLTMTRKVKLVGEFVLPPTPVSFAPIPSSTGVYTQGIYGVFSGTMINRTVLDEMPDKRRILRLKSPWSWSHGIESVALMVQRMFGSKGR